MFMNTSKLSQNRGKLHREFEQTAESYFTERHIRLFSMWLMNDKRQKSAPFDKLRAGTIFMEKLSELG